jgi:hypothetical protein
MVVKVATLLELTNGFITTTLLMRLVQFTNLEAGLMDKIVVRCKCVETASQAKLVMFPKSFTLTV